MKKIQISLYFLISGALLIPNILGAADVNVVPSVSVKQERNDNVFLTDGNEVSDDITTLSGGLLVQRTGPRLDAGVRGNLDSVTYWEKSDLDSLDFDLNAFLDHKLTPRFSWKADTRYIKDSRPDRDLEISGLVLNADAREQMNGGLSASYQLGKKTTTAVSYQFNREEYESPDYSDVSIHSAFLDFGRDISASVRETTAHLRFSMSRYDFDLADIDSYSLTAGLRHRITDVLDLRIYAGARRTDTEYTFLPISNEDWGGVGEITLRYRLARTLFSLTGVRDVRTVSGESGTAEQTAVIGNIQYRLNRGLTADISGGFYLNAADSAELSSQDVDRRTFRVSPRFIWHLSENIDLSGTYAFAHYENDETGVNADRNLLFISLSWQTDIVK